MDIAPSISNPQSLITEQTPTSQRECFVEESSPDNVWSSVVKGKARFYPYQHNLLYTIVQNMSVLVYVCHS